MTKKTTILFSILLGIGFVLMFAPPATASDVIIASLDAADALECCEMAHGCTSSVLWSDYTCTSGCSIEGAAEYGKTSSNLDCLKNKYFHKGPH